MSMSSNLLLLFAAPPELIVVLLLLLLLFGTSRLPKVGRAVGEAIPAWKEGRSSDPTTDDNGSEN